MRRPAAVDEVGEDVPEAEFRRPNRALRRGAEQPRRRRPRPTGQSAETGEGVILGQVVGEVGQQFGQLLREVVGRGLVAIALQGEAGGAVGPRRPADAEVDAVAEKSAEHGEVFGDLQRAVVRQHDAAAAEADGGRRRADHAEQHFGRRAGEAGRAVVLGDPVAGVTGGFGEFCQVDAVPQRLCPAAALRDGRLVEHAQPQRARGVGRGGFDGERGGGGHARSYESAKADDRGRGQAGAEYLPHPARSHGVCGRSVPSRPPRRHEIFKPTNGGPP